MNGRAGLLLAGIALCAAACSTPTTPTSPLAGDDSAPTASAGVQFLPSSPALATYDTTFFVVQGEHSEHVVTYAEGSSAAGQVFLRVDVPHNAAFVDAQGEVVPEGTVVPVRVQLSRDSLSFKFEPHGSTFRRPVKLRIDYSHTDLAGIDPEQLTMWYQASDGLAWTKVPVSVDLGSAWLQIDLKHFSNYAVAF